jgi:ribosome-binding factor A
MPREFARQQRLGAEMQRLLNELLLTEVKDPRLDGVRVTEVELSRDLGVAKVYFSTLAPDEDPELARQGFEKAGGFLRSRVSRVLRVRKVPELRFLHDESARRGAELSRLIDEVAPKPTDDEEDDSGS